MFADSVQAPEPVKHGIVSAAYNYLASGVNAVTEGIGSMILMDGVNPPGFEEEIQPGRIKIEFTQNASGGDPDGLTGLSGKERSAVQLRMLRSMMVAGGLRPEQVEEGETPFEAVLVDPTNNALRLAKYQSFVASMKPGYGTL